jgi:hypothetical protein
MTEAKHSLFSASAAHRWSVCPGSITLAAGRSGPPSVHAARGTVAHSLLEAYLTEGVDPNERVGDVVEQDGFEIEVDDDMADAVRVAIDNIEEVSKGALVRLSEHRVNYAHDLAVKHDDGWGTADVIALLPGELQVHDYKHGYKVVDAQDNPQLLLYAAGALHEVEDLVDEPIERVRMFVHQPNVSDAPSEWSIPVSTLRQRLKDLRNAANRALAARQVYGCAVVDKVQIPGMPRQAWEQEYLRPGDAQCQWCPASGTCPAARSRVEEVLTGATAASPDEFMAVVPDDVVLDAKAWVQAHNDPAWLAAVLSASEFIEGVLDAAREAAFGILQSGGEVPGYKLVRGKRGARRWADAAAAEEYLRKTVRLPIEKAYNLKLVSPTQAEKLVKAGDLGERQWKKLAELIEQPDGKLHVAPSNDPRPALMVQSAVSEFQPVTNDADDIG